MKMADYQPFGKVTNHTPQIAYERVLDYAGASLRRGRTAFYILDETGYVYTYGATLHAPRIGAVQTAFGLCQSLFLGQSPVHFFLAAV